MQIDRLGRSLSCSLAFVATATAVLREAPSLWLFTASCVTLICRSLLSSTSFTTQRLGSLPSRFLSRHLHSAPDNSPASRDRGTTILPPTRTLGIAPRRTNL